MSVTRSFRARRPHPYQGLHPGLFAWIAPATWANDVPQETVVNRWAPMACGPNVDQTRPAVQALGAEDLEEIVADFSDDAMLISPAGVLRRHAAPNP